MKKLLNTLYVTSENSYLALDGENVVIYEHQDELGRLPLHNLEGIVSFGYRGTSPALMGACADRNISLCYMTPQGKFLARVTGRVHGNVLLREQQYMSSKTEKIGLEIAKNCITGKVYNARWVIERALRDHPLQVDTERLKKASFQLKEALSRIQDSISREQLRGYEGEAASIYFGVFDELILQQKKDFFFHERSKRPPMDNVNALLSFVYTLLTNNITAALENKMLKELFSNCNYKCFLDQGCADANALAQIQELSQTEFNALNSEEVGKGVMVWGKKVVLFDAKISKENELYPLINTNFHEKAKEAEKKKQKQRQEQQESNDRIEEIILQMAELAPVTVRDLLSVLEITQEEAEKQLSFLCQQGYLIKTEEAGNIRYQKAG